MARRQILDDDDDVDFLKDDDDNWLLQPAALVRLTTAFERYDSDDIYPFLGGRLSIPGPERRSRKQLQDLFPICELTPSSQDFGGTRR